MEKTKTNKKLMLALLSLHLPYDAIMEMTEVDANAYLDVWLDINEGEKKVYRVRKGRKG